MGGKRKFSEEDIMDLMAARNEMDRMEARMEAGKEEPVEFWSYADSPEIAKLAQQKKGFSLGSPTLDFLTGNIEPGELIVITAPTGVGKTTLARTLSWNMAQRDIPSLWFTLEESTPVFLRAFWGNDTGAQWSTDGTLTKVSGAPLYFPKDTEQVSFTNLQHIIKYASVKYGIQAVFIDHLHYLVQTRGRADMLGNFSLVLGDRVRELRRIALETKVTMFLIAHMTKTDEGTRPTLNDIRDSSFVAQEADHVFVLWRDRMKEPVIVNDGERSYEETFYPHTNCAVEKSRRTGRRGQIYLLHDRGLYREATQAQVSEIRSKIEMTKPKYATRPGG